MTTLLEIPLRDIKPSAIEELKNKYPGATLRIEAANALHSGQMDEDQFWAIIDLLDWKQAEREAIVDPAVEALSALPGADIRAFHQFPG